jgi:prepilin-type processing-associated H-X9-DG protein
MLVPALKNAREKAKEITCRNNLKQIGLAFNMYSSDYNGFYPPRDSGGCFIPPYWSKCLIDHDVLTEPIVYNTHGGCPNQKSLHPTGWIWCYGMNYYLNQDKKRHLKTSSQTMLVMDAERYYVTPTQYMSWVHGTRANIVYCDMHVNAMRFIDRPVAATNPFWGAN